MLLLGVRIVELIQAEESCDNNDIGDEKHKHFAKYETINVSA